MGETFYLMFPQWQGSGAEEAVKLYDGAWQLQSLVADKPFKGVSVMTDERAATEQDVVARADLLKHLSEAKALIERAAPERIVTLGGDCGVDLAPASYLKQRYGSDLALLWLDAHSDLNTPASSPSKTFHGMALRALLGEGDPELKGFAPLEPHGVFLAGVRDFDPPEVAYFEENRMSLFKPKDLEMRPEALAELIEARGFSKLHIHLDLDVLDPSEFAATGFPTPNGLGLESLGKLLKRLDATFDVVGLTITEFMPQAQDDLSALERILEAAPLVSFQSDSA